MGQSMRRASVINPVRDLAMIEARANFSCSPATKGVDLEDGLNGEGWEEGVSSGSDETRSMSSARRI